ncbi:MAG: methionyl-tRNA formyltransferase [Anaerolineae bacterium]|nr:methionyl-tRNA formyltransferase [Anaerolineae bacterium]
MGTPEFAVPVLAALAKHHDLVGVITQPDRPAGRGGAKARPVPPPAKEAALARGLPVYQPQTLRTPEAVEQVARWRPDVVVVAAFGQILRPNVLALPTYGCLNVHASLLPCYRGAAPIPAAILAGEPVSGVTLMVMDEGLDTGPILAQKEWPLAPYETTASLTGSLARLGARLVVEILPHWLAGVIRPQPQDESQATWSRPLTKEDGLLDWSQPAVMLDRRVRACEPWPGAYTWIGGERLRILRTCPRPEWSGEGSPGQIVAAGTGIGVVTGRGMLELLELQLAGKRALNAELFAQGRRGLIGDRLG